MSTDSLPATSTVTPRAPGRRRPVRKVLRMGPRRWLFLVRVVATATVFEALIRTRPLPVAARAAGVSLTFGASGPTRPEDGWQLLTARERERCELALRVIAHRPFDRTCLRRSLLLGNLLRRRDPVLRIGVAKADGAVAAHAWIEIEGASLDRGHSDFQVLDDVVDARRSGHATGAADGPAVAAS